MTNLIFDLNNIAFRSMFIVSGYGSKHFTFDSQSELDQLMRKIAIDTTHIIRLINPSRIIFAKDDRSWRKDLKIDENDGYKAQRTKLTHVNWDNVYGALDEFCDILENNGIIVTKIENAEADDVISMYTYELMDVQSQHVIIVSGDEDLRQLVKYKTLPFNDKMAFTTVYNPFMQGKNASKKLYVPKYFEEWVNTPDVVDFMNLKGTVDVDKEDFKKIISAEKTKMEYVDGNMIALRKMFCGDDGDNVPSIYTWLNDKDTEVRITNSKFEKIYEELLLNESESINHNTIISRSDKVLNILKKITKQNISLDIKSRIERQVKLVVLDTNFFPKEIVSNFNKIKNAELQKPRVNFANLNMQNLLSGTKYVSNKTRGTEASIFKEIDRLTGNALF